MLNDSLSADDEEDFLELLGTSSVKVASPPTNMPPPAESANQASVFEPVHHVLHSEDEEESTLENDFASALAEFYSKHNFANLDKVPYLVEKFSDRRWDMWEQLCIKYRLSASQSVKIWTEFGLMSECKSRVFLLSKEDAPPDHEFRADTWLFLLACSKGEHSGDYCLFKNMQPREVDGVRCHIARDVCRTHQDFEFFQKVC